MDNVDSTSEDTTQKRKRRPKSYQGCTQCRLARRKCGEGTLRPHRWHFLLRQRHRMNGLSELSFLL